MSFPYFIGFPDTLKGKEGRKFFPSSTDLAENFKSKEYSFPNSWILAGPLEDLEWIQPSISFMLSNLDAHVFLFGSAPWTVPEIEACDPSMEVFGGRRKNAKITDFREKSQ